MTKKILAALQIGSSASGTKQTIEKILAFEEPIKQCHCQLLVMPEALVGGYPKGADFGTRVGYRTDEGRTEFLKYWQQAVEMDGAELAILSKMAKRCKTCLVIGVIERAEATLYCTAVFISDDGHIIGKHRKIMPTASERLIWGQGDGSTLPVLETSAGRIGAAICWENYMPLLRTTMYAKKLDIWCAPTVDDRDIWQSSMRHIAYEGRNFLISACQYLPPPAKAKLKDKNWPEDKPLIRGGSVIISPLGERLTEPLYNTEGLIHAEIDLNDIIKARYDLDTVGHYSRPDIFKLSVDETPRPAYKTIKESSEL